MEKQQRLKTKVRIKEKRRRENRSRVRKREITLPFETVLHTGSELCHMRSSFRECLVAQFFIALFFCLTSVNNRKERRYFGLKRFYSFLSAQKKH
jgi:hypothetical protein